MTKRNSTKQALVASVLALCMCFTMLVGTTFAWFTDSATSGGNVIQAGNLIVEMYYADGTLAVPADDSSDWINADGVAVYGADQLWEPGYTDAKHIKISNEGTLALKYKLAIIPTGEVSDLAEVIDVYVYEIDDTDDNATQIADRADLDESMYVGTLADVISAGIVSGNLSADADYTTTIVLKMKNEAGNEYSGLTIGDGFALRLVATQYTAESDSFDNMYDADADFPNVSFPVSVPAEDVSTSIALNANGMAVEVPAEVINALPADVKSISVSFSTPVVEDNTLKFPKVDLLDQNYEAIDLNGNTSAIAVTLPAQTEFAPGTTVIIYHDGEYVDTAIVAADGTISYEAVHFCEVVVSDTPIASENRYDVKSAEEFIAILSEIKADAKQQIPGENGNKKYRREAVFVLQNDIVLDSADDFMYTDSNGGLLHFYGVKGVLDLNGHTITATSGALLDGKSYANGVLLIQYSDVDIIGEGSIVAENKSIPVYAWANGSVNIYGGDYVTNASERGESAIYVNNPSIIVNVYGGTYTNSEYAFNAHDNCKTTTVIVLHEGIAYKTYLKNGATDLIASDMNAGRIVIADGCEIESSVVDGVTFNKVVK